MCLSNKHVGCISYRLYGHDSVLTRAVLRTYVLLLGSGRPQEGFNIHGVPRHPLGRTQPSWDTTGRDSLLAGFQGIFSAERSIRGTPREVFNISRIPRDYSCGIQQPRDTGCPQAEKKRAQAQTRARRDSTLTGHHGIFGARSSNLGTPQQYFCIPGHPSVNCIVRVLYPTGSERPIDNTPPPPRDKKQKKLGRGDAASYVAIKDMSKFVFFTFFFLSGIE